MGIELWECERCSAGIADCGDYFRCHENHLICDDCMRECKTGSYSETIDEDGVFLDNCPFCNLQSVTTFDLLNFLLGRLELNREQAEQQYIEFYGGADGD